MSTHSPSLPRRLRAKILGFGLDGLEDHDRVITGDHSLVCGGSAETHAELLDVMLRLEGELLALDRSLAELNPTELGEMAQRINLPELQEIADRLQSGLDSTGLLFCELSADELTNLSTGPLFSR